MTRITIEYPAQEGEIYAPDTFRDQVGGTIPLRTEDSEPVMATLVEVGVARDGRRSFLTLDLPDQTAVETEKN